MNKKNRPAKRGHQTIELTRFQRFPIMWTARIARRTANQSWMRVPFRFDYGEGGFGHYFNAQAAHFGERMKLKAPWPQEVRDALTNLTRSDNEAPYVVLRDLYPILHRRFAYASMNTWFLKGGIYDIISSGLIALTGNRHRRKHANDNVYRDYKSVFSKQKHQALPDEDLPLRYRNATPELLFPDEAVFENENDLAVRIIVFACIENPIQDPIWILPLSAVLAELDPDDVELLCRPAFAVYDRIATSLLQRDPRPDQSILSPGDGPGEYYVSLDPNRIAFWHEDTGQEHRHALSNLFKCIEALGEDESKGAIPVVLKAGDALVIDNYRMLYCRKEPPYQSFQPVMLGRRAQRWLRSYYGFPPFTPAQTNLTSEDRPFEQTDLATPRPT